MKRDFRTHLRGLNPSVSCALGAVFLAGAFFSRIIGGSPMYVILQNPCFRFGMPTAWGLFWSSAYFLLGFFTGLLLPRASCRAGTEALKWALVAVLFSLFWYPAFFLAMRPVLALLIAVASVVLAVVAAIRCARVCIPCTVAYGVFAAYLVYCAVRNLAFLLL